MCVCVCVCLCVIFTQTDIIGGHAVLVKDGPRPFVGSHADYGEDPSAHGFYNAGEA